MENTIQKQTAINLVNEYIEEVVTKYYDFEEDLTDEYPYDLDKLKTAKKIFNLPVNDQLEVLVTIVEQPNGTRIEEYEDKVRSSGITFNAILELLQKMLSQEFEPTESQLLLLLSGYWNITGFISMAHKYVLKQGLSLQMKESLVKRKERLSYFSEEDIKLIEEMLMYKG